MVFQIQMTRDQAAVPLTRDYMIEAERSPDVTPAFVSKREAAVTRFHPPYPPDSQPQRR